MTSSSVSPIPTEKAPTRDRFLAPALAVSIVIAVFAVVAQLLAATGATSLSSTQALTMWLVALGLIALLWIAYMICRAYVAARPGQAHAEEELEAVRHQLDGARRDAAQQKERAEKADAEAAQARAAAPEASERLNEALAAKANVEKELKAAQAEIDRLRVESQLKAPAASDRPAPVPTPDGSGGEDDEDTWVPPDELRYLDGSEHPVDMTKVFPDGCYLEPDSVRIAMDKLTGQLVYRYRILDLNSALKYRTHETVVRIPASHQSSLPPMPRFGWVVFDGLTITPYVIDRSRMRIRYALHAKSIHPAAPTEKRFPAMWTAAAS